MFHKDKYERGAFPGGMPPPAETLKIHCTCKAFKELNFCEHALDLFNLECDVTSEVKERAEQAIMRANPNIIYEIQQIGNRERRQSGDLAPNTIKSAMKEIGRKLHASGVWTIRR